MWLKNSTTCTRSVLGPSSAPRTISRRFCLGLSSVFVCRFKSRAGYYGTVSRSGKPFTPKSIYLNMSNTTYLLALDQGTSSCRSLVFSPAGDIVAMAQQEFRQIYPQPGWVEHDPLEIWQRTQEVIAGAISSALGSATSMHGPYKMMALISGCFEAK